MRKTLPHIIRMIINISSRNQCMTLREIQDDSHVGHGLLPNRESSKMGHRGINTRFATKIFPQKIYQ